MNKSSLKVENSCLTCPCCESNVSKIWAIAKDYEYESTRDEKFNYQQCQDCDTIFLETMPIDRLSTIYPSNYYSFLEQPTGFIYRIKGLLDQFFFRRILKSIPGDSIRALDIGGGTGWVLDSLSSVEPRLNISQIVDIDPDAQQLAEAKGHRFFCGRIEDFESEEKFDLVLLLNIIEHVADPKEVLKKISDNLTDNGVAIIKTPNIDSLDARLFKNSYWGGLHCPRHWVLFSDRSIRPLINKSGLKIVSQSLTQGAPFWAWSILIWLQRRGIVKINKQRPVTQHPLHNTLQAIFAFFDFSRGIFSKTSQMMLVLKKSNSND